MKIGLGITGCIAAYKSVELIRLFQKRGDEVFPIITQNGLNFITELTLSSISGNKTTTEMFSGVENWDVKHISLARKIDVLLVAPATANIIAKFANGIADDFLSTLYLSFEGKVVIAPAMNKSMWSHPATKRNVEILKERGNIIVNPESGYLACKEEGEGRLADLEKILNYTYHALREKDFKGKRAIITAGATREFIDPIRFITNRSSGKMGISLAREFWLRGGEVILIKGKNTPDVKFDIEVIECESAEDMFKKTVENFSRCDICIMAAAVSDYTPLRRESEKIKKNSETLNLKLKRTTDILKELSKIKKKNQILIGFAAETENLKTNAQKKLKSKNLDFIVLNDVKRKDIGFESDENEISILFKDGREKFFKKSKKEIIAKYIVDEIKNIGEK